MCMRLDRPGALATMDKRLGCYATGCRIYIIYTWERGRVHGREVAAVPARLAPHHALHADAEVHHRRWRGQAAHGGGAAAETEEHDDGEEGQQHALITGKEISHRRRRRVASIVDSCPAAA